MDRAMLNEAKDALGRFANIWAQICVAVQCAAAGEAFVGETVRLDMDEAIILIDGLDPNEANWLQAALDGLCLPALQNSYVRYYNNGALGEVTIHLTGRTEPA